MADEVAHVFTKVWVSNTPWNFSLLGSKALFSVDDFSFYHGWGYVTVLPWRVSKCFALLGVLPKMYCFRGIGVHG